MTRWFIRIGAVIVMLAPGVWAASATLAQDASRSILEKAAPAVVRIRAVRGVDRAATGVTIDRRGYVLTNFHAVGHISASNGIPGSLFSKANRYELELYDPRSEDPVVWVARVVRGDIRADLALLRLMAPMGRDNQQGYFPSVAWGSTQGLGRNSVLWAIGYKDSGAKPTLVRVTVKDIKRSQLSRLSWIYFQPGIDKGFTGGALLNSMASVTAVSTGAVEQTKANTFDRARPVERISNDWLDALKRGDIHDTKIEGFKALADAGEAHELAEGDGPTAQQSHFFAAPTRRPVTISVTPQLPLTLLSPSGKVLNRGNGTMTLSGRDPQDAIVEIDVSKSLKQALAYSIKTGATGPATTSTITTAATADPTLKGNAVLTGRLVHAVTGEPLKDAVVSVGKPGTDMEKLMARFLRGEIGRSELQTKLLGQARTDRNGRFQIRDLPKGKGLPLAGYKMTFRPVYLNAQLGANQSRLDLGNIKVTYWEPIAY